MGRRKDTRAKVEFGDFQTPPELALEVCQLLAMKGCSPMSIVEPTCGAGSLLVGALNAFPTYARAVGIDVNKDYVESVSAILLSRVDAARATAVCKSFFEEDWPARISELQEPILFIGNPPWVTSSDLGYLKSHNIPEKGNFHGRTGLDAVTGKSNFDISEWMLTKLLNWLDGRNAVVAMLCKTAVARKVLAFAWNAGYRISSAATYRIDAAKHFGAAVDACLLVCEMGPSSKTFRCATFESLASQSPNGTFGITEGSLVANVELYERRKNLIGESQYKWRSGVKHDCAAVMELRRINKHYKNGDGEMVELETDLIYPMLKSSDVAKGETTQPNRFMIVTQKRVGADTLGIEQLAPSTWRYLTDRRASFDKRGSSIYKGKPPFSIFGVGDYTFAPWKVGISGLYKKLEFRVVGPYEGKPVVLDDTCYFIGCGSETEARFVFSLLSSKLAKEFYSAFVFWDAKRPITTDLLRRLDLWRLAQELDMASEFQSICVLKTGSDTIEESGSNQLMLGGFRA